MSCGRYVRAARAPSDGFDCSRADVGAAVRDRSFMALCLLVLVNQMGFGIITPVLPAYARGFGLGAGSVGIVVGTYGLARFVANVPAGRVAELRGRRTTLIVGTVITSVASALIATATTLPELIGYRLLAGVGAATVLTGGEIMAGDLSTPENRGRMMSLYQGFFLIGVGLGPTPGGVLADNFGLRAPFIAYAVFSAAACGIALFFIRETRPERAQTVRASPAPRDRAGRAGTVPEAVQTVRSVALSSGFILIGAISFAQFFGRTGAMFTVVPLQGKDELHLSASQIGVALTVVNLLNLAVVYHSGSLADRFGRKRVIVPATVISGMAMALFAVGGGYLVYLAGAAIWGLGSGLAGPAPAAYVADIAPAALRGSLWGIYRTIADLGYVIGPILLGWMAQASGYRAPLLLTAIMLAVVAALFARLAPEVHRPDPTTRLAPAIPAAEG
ncbi:MAG: MFS transporter [Dehalococcoidia bacterium]